MKAERSRMIIKGVSGRAGNIVALAGPSTGALIALLAALGYGAVVEILKASPKIKALRRRRGHFKEPGPWWPYPLYLPQSWRTPCVSFQFADAMYKCATPFSGPMVFDELPRYLKGVSDYDRWMSNTLGHFLRGIPVSWWIDRRNWRRFTQFERVQYQGVETHFWNRPLKPPTVGEMWGLHRLEFGAWDIYDAAGKLTPYVGTALWGEAHVPYARGGGHGYYRLKFFSDLWNGELKYTFPWTRTGETWNIAVHVEDCMGRGYFGVDYCPCKLGAYGLDDYEVIDEPDESRIVEFRNFWGRSTWKHWPCFLPSKLGDMKGDPPVWPDIVPVPPDRQGVIRRDWPLPRAFWWAIADYEAPTQDVEIVWRKYIRTG